MASVIGGSDNLDTSAVSVGTSGYVKLQGGLILQWGRTSSIVNASEVVTFPIAFPTACVNMTVTLNPVSGTVADTTACTAQIDSASSATVFNTSNSYTGQVSWQAIGY